MKVNYDREIASNCCQNLELKNHAGSQYPYCIERWNDHHEYSNIVRTYL